MAYTLIETVTVGAGGASSIEFTGIPQEAGADLVLKFSAQTNYSTNPSADYASVTFNSDTGTNYGNMTLYGQGETTSSFNYTGAYLRMPWFAVDAQTPFGSVKCYISNYASSTTKSISLDGVSEANQVKSYQALWASNWTGTSGISSMQLAPVQGTLFLEYTTASLYLVTTADATGANSNPTYTQKATGGTVTFSNGYYYHAFTGSGTFTPTESITADVLRVAGGGGGGSWKGGGGGAGGFITSQHALTATNYTVVIGAGGAGTNTGNNTTFTGLSNAIAGGNGGAGNNASGAGAFGGSGGGGGYASGSGGGSGSQGNNGAGGQSASSGGGGGAEFPGYTGSQSPSGGGYGGGGLVWFNGTVYAGGGGGGTNFNSAGGAGGDGGGGNGAKSGASGTAGQSNTGGGGGSLEFTGGQPGGSGIVIVRYAG